MPGWPKVSIAPLAHARKLAISGSSLASTLHICPLLRSRSRRRFSCRLPRYFFRRAFGSGNTLSAAGVYDPVFFTLLDFAVGLSGHLRDTFCLSWTSLVHVSGEWQLRFLGHFALTLLKLKLVQMATLELVARDVSLRIFRHMLLPPRSDCLT